MAGAAIQSSQAQTCTDPTVVVGSGQTCSAVTITSNSATISVSNGGAIYESFSDALTINGSSAVINNSGTIGTINNGGNYGITVTGDVTSLTNTSTGYIGGTSVSTDSDYGIVNSGTVVTITNMGAIVGLSYGIYNFGTIGTLNNAQGVGNTNGALTYIGVLPTNYNIIITSTSNYGQLAVTSGTGNTTFGISSLSTRGNGILGSYSSIITGLTNTQLGVTGTSVTGTSNGYGYTLTESVTTPTAEVWDLTITSAPAPIVTGPSTADTQESLTQAATALRSVFNQQTAVINNSLNYDCMVFAENGLCVSGGGRFSTPNSITGERGSTLLVASYQALKNVRVGGFIDQNVSSTNSTGVSIDKSPMYGVFGVWNQNPNLMGYEVRLATNWSDQNITQTRNVVGTSEAGTGTASLKSQAISGVVSYAMPVTDSTWVASPYAGVRKTKVTRGSYTETSAVTTPLTYNDLSQDITTALAGVRMNKKFSDNVYVTGSVGVEQNMGSSISTLDATGVTGLTATDFNANYAKTRPVASAGASYSIDKNQRISLSAMYRKEAFQSSGSTTALLMYQVGL